jgi:hypothetical protein
MLASHILPVGGSGRLHINPGISKRLGFGNPDFTGIYMSFLFRTGFSRHGARNACCFYQLVSQ